MSCRSPDLSPRERADVGYYYTNSLSTAPIQISLRQLPGTCKRVLADGIVCGLPFVGPRNRRYCNSHSSSIHYGGRSTPDPSAITR
jgi:hypothetical protein